MHTNDDVSIRYIIKFVIPLLILAGYWIFGFIKGLIENNTEDNSNPQRDVKYYSKKIKSEPYNYKNYLTRGYASLKLYDYEGALKDFAKAIELNSNCWEAYANKGLVYYYLEQEQNALKEYNTAITINPDSVTLRYNRALLYYYLKDFDNAITDLKKALELAPEDENCLSLYGKIQYEHTN